MRTSEYQKNDDIMIEREVKLWNEKIQNQSHDDNPEKRKPSYFFGLILICSTLLYVVVSGNRISQKDMDEQRLTSLENKIDDGYRLSELEAVEYCKLLKSVRNIHFNHCENLAMLGARLIQETEQKVNCYKRDFLFPDKSSAMNWSRILLGHNTKETFNERGQLNGWETPKGDTVYWNHGDWITGLEKSKFPHLNYIVDNCKGHLFLKDKIKNAKLWEEFTEYFKL